MTVNLDELVTSWLDSQVEAWVSSVRPGNLEKLVPVVVSAVAGGTDRDGPWLLQVTVDIDVFAAPPAGASNEGGWGPATDLAWVVDAAFVNRTPAVWRGRQLTFLRRIQVPIKVPDGNVAVRHMASSYSLSVK